MKSKTKKNPTLIIGMHRSGTSFLSRAFNLCGLSLGSEDGFYDTDVDSKFGNPRGHWENNDINELNEEILKINGGSWYDIPPKLDLLPDEFDHKIKKIFEKSFQQNVLTYGFKDPRLTVTLDKWIPHISLFNIVGIFRHPLKVAESIKIRNGFDYDYSLKLWQVYNQKLLNMLQKYDGFLIDFDLPREKLLQEVKIVSKKLGLLDVDIDFWFSSEFKKSDKSFNDTYPIPPEINKLYENLKKISKNNSQKNDIVFDLTIDDYYSILQDLQTRINFAHEDYTKLYTKKINEFKIKKLLLIQNNPILRLIGYYNSRKDLQKAFPEIFTNLDFSKIINWIIDVCTNKIPNEKEAVALFSPFLDNYIEFTKNNLLLNHEIDQHKSNISLLESDKKSLTSTIGTLESDKKSLTSTIGTLESDKKSLTSTIGTLESDKKSLTSTIGTLESDKKSLTSTIGTLESDKKSLTSTIGTLESDKKSLTSTIGTLESDKKSLTSTIGTLESDKKSLTSTIGTLESDKKSLTSTINKNSFLISDLTDKNNSLIEKVLNQSKERRLIALDNVNLHNILNQQSVELNTIKSSKGFKIIRSYGKLIDGIVNSKFGKFILILPYSMNVIKKEGLSSFFHHVRVKLTNREFEIIPTNNAINSSNLPKKHNSVVYSKIIKDRNNLQSNYEVSVVIPTNATKENITAVIDQLFMQQGLKSLEIILVNSGHADLSNLKNIGNVIVITIPSTEFNHGRARNTGVSKATGNFIVVQTDDAIPINNYLYYDMCKKFSEDVTIAAVSARQIPSASSDLISQFSLNKHYFYLGLDHDVIRSEENFDNLDFHSKRKVSQIDDVCTCYDAKIIKDYLFKEIKYAEDLELGIRFIKNGFSICQLYESGVIHSHNRPTPYHFKRSYVDSMWLFNLLGSDNEPIQEYNSLSEFSFDVLHMFNALNSVVDNLTDIHPVTCQEACDFIRTSMSLLFSHNIQSTSSDMELYEILDDVFDFKKQTPVLKSKLLPRFIDTINRYDHYMRSSNAHIFDRSKEFHESLYKILATCIGASLFDFLNASKEHIISNKVKTINQKMGGI